MLTRLVQVDLAGPAEFGQSWKRAGGRSARDRRFAYREKAIDQGDRHCLSHRRRRLANALVRAASWWRPMLGSTAWR